jgi:hypothetical protein
MVRPTPEKVFAWSLEQRDQNRKYARFMPFKKCNLLRIIDIITGSLQEYTCWQVPVLIVILLTQAEPCSIRWPETFMPSECPKQRQPSYHSEFAVSPEKMFAESRFYFGYPTDQ